MTTSKSNTRNNHAELLKSCFWTLFESIGHLPKSTLSGSESGSGFESGFGSDSESVFVLVLVLVLVLNLFLVLWF